MHYTLLECLLLIQIGIILLVIWKLKCLYYKSSVKKKRRIFRRQIWPTNSVAWDDDDTTEFVIKIINKGLYFFLNKICIKNNNHWLLFPFKTGQKYNKKIEIKKEKRKYCRMDTDNNIEETKKKCKKVNLSYKKMKKGKINV